MEESIMIAIGVVLIFAVFFAGIWELGKYCGKKQTERLKKLEAEGRCININDFIRKLNVDFVKDKIIVESWDLGNTKYHIIRKKENGRYDIWKIGESPVAANLTEDGAIKLLKQWKARNKN